MIRGGGCCVNALQEKQEKRSKRGASKGTQLAHELSAFPGAVPSQQSRDPRPGTASSLAEHPYVFNRPSVCSPSISRSLGEAPRTTGSAVLWLLRIPLGS
jgi:hypothetical protein